MKKLLSVLLVLAVLVAGVATFAACNPDDDKGPAGEVKVEMAGYNPTTDGAMKVAMITDYGDITDQSFNQTTYEACRDFTTANSLTFKYFKPANDSTEARVASVNTAIQEGFNVIVMPGYAFGDTIKEVAEANLKVTFVALDVGAGDLGDYKLPGNVATFVYKEELSGFMAGYAAVKEGYKKLGFLGGMAVPAVIRFGYGFVQGANTAAVEMNIANQVSVEYVYGGQFFGDAAITAVMDTWYGTKDVEVVFACGGGIFTSACEAATKAGINGKVIGVDTDQGKVINKPTAENGYGAGVCITSAMKGLAPTVQTILTAIKGGNWKNYFGTINTLGMVSGTDADLNYVQLPTDEWLMTNFTAADYATLVYRIEAGIYAISDTTSAMPAHKIAVTTYDNIH